MDMECFVLETDDRVHTDVEVVRACGWHHWLMITACRTEAQVFCKQTRS